MGSSTINGWDTRDDSPYGLTHGIFDITRNMDPQLFVDAVALPLSRIRINVSAILVEPSPNQFTWTVLDDAIYHCNRVGLRVTFCIREFGPKGGGASWATYPNPCDPATPYHYGTPTNFANYAVSVALRYSGQPNGQNAKAPDGRLLWIDNLEIGNEDFDVHGPSTGDCRNPMRYVLYARIIGAALRKPVSQQGAGWTRRLGSWGCWWQDQTHIKAVYNTLCNPATDSTYNPTGDHTSLFSSTGLGGYAGLDYANFHNYKNPAFGNTSSPYSLDQELDDIRGVLNSYGHTTVPIWITEFGADGPVGNVSEAAQSTYFAANPDGSGNGALAAARDHRAQHIDIYTMDGLGSGNGTNPTYYGDTKSIAAAVRAGGSTRFLAFTTVQNFIKANPTFPFGFSGSTGGGGGGGGGGGPTLTTVAVDSFANRTVDSGWGAASDGTSGSWVSYTEPTATAPTLAVSPTNKAQFSGTTGCIANILLGTQTLTDCDALVRTKVTITGDNAGPSLRSNAAGTIYYRCSLSGGILELTYLNNGVRTNLYQSAALGYSANTWYWIRFRIIGTTLYGRYWADGTTEPTDFTNPSYAFTYILSGTDPTLTSGQFGLRARTASTSSIITFDQFTASSLNASGGGGGGNPPPLAGSLTGSLTPLAASTINLTTDTASGGDYAHWGLLTGTTFDRKSSGGSHISNFTVLGNASAQQNPAALNSFTYSDGTPNNATGTSTGSKVVPPSTGGGGGGSTSPPHVMVVAMENTGYTGVTTGSYPHVQALLSTYSTCTNAYGFSHPSLPNYVAFASGSDQGIINDTYNPASTPLAGTTLVDQLAAAGIAWKHYAEYLPSTGYLGGDSGTYPSLYVQHHNPWVYFKSIRSNAAQFNQIVNYSQLASDLAAGTAPPFIFVQPGNDHNAHTGTDTAADTFVNGLVTTVLASTWYTQNKGIILLWWDESGPGDTDKSGIGDTSSNATYPHGGHIACCVISASNSGAVLSSNLNHMGVVRGIQKLYGLTPYLGDAAHTINGDLTPLLGTSGGSTGGGGGPATSNLGNGFTLTAPADTNPRTLNLYTDVNQGIATLAAALSDGSAPDLYNSSLSDASGGNASAGVYTLTYAAASTGQTLTLNYTLSDNGTPGIGTASDTFTRANRSGLGTASDGETYTTVIESGSPAWSIVSNAAQLSGTTGDIGIALLGSHTLQDGEAVGIVNLSSTGDSGGLVLRSNGAATSYYRASLTSSVIKLTLRNSGTDTVLKSQPITLSPNTNYWLRFRILKNCLYARYWPADGSKEPGNWNVVVIDTTLTAAGQFGFRGLIGTTSDVVLFDTYSIVDLSATGDPSFVSLYAAELPTSVATATGTLSGSVSTPTGPVDLTAESGIGDWTHWGFSSAANIERKASVPTQISTYSSIGSGSPTQNTASLLGATWSDGTPDGAITNSLTESDVQGIANGFSFTIPADTVSRTLNVYVAAKSAQGQFTAILSDGSAPSYTDSSLNDAGSGTIGKYTLTFTAASANQTLTVQWILLTDNGGTGTTTSVDSDTFTRANNSSSWGTASGGNTWAQNGTITASLVSNAGQLTGLAGNQARSYLGSGTVANGEAKGRVSFSNNGSSGGLALRGTAANTCYAAEFLAGIFSLVLNTNGTQTILKQVTTPAISANTKYWIRFQLNGSNLYGRYWADGSSEPTSWTLTATDTTLSGSGQYGMRSRIAPDNATITYDSYTLTTLPSSGTPGSIGLHSATTPTGAGSNSGGGGGGGGNPPPSVSLALTVNASDALTTPFLGVGIEQDPYTIQ